MTNPCCQPASIIDLAKQGQLLRLKRITVEKVDDESDRTKTEIIATVFETGQDMGFPVILIEDHPSDEIAMRHLLDLFDAMHASGTASRDQIARWRRSLVVAVQ